MLISLKPFPWPHLMMFCLLITLVRGFSTAKFHSEGNNYINRFYTIGYLLGHDQKTIYLISTHSVLLEMLNQFWNWNLLLLHCIVRYSWLTLYSIFHIFLVIWWVYCWFQYRCLHQCHVLACSRTLDWEFSPNGSPIKLVYQAIKAVGATEWQEGYPGSVRTDSWHPSH